MKIEITGLNPAASCEMRKPIIKAKKQEETQTPGKAFAKVFKEKCPLITSFKKPVIEKLSNLPALATQYLDIPDRLDVYHEKINEIIEWVNNHD